MINFLQHWNDILTIVLAIITIFTGYYKIKHYRAEASKIKIIEIKDAKYIGRKRGPGGYFENSTDENTEETIYTIDLIIENDGRELATISNAELEIFDTNEELKLSNKQSKGYKKSEIVQFSENDRKNIVYKAIGRSRETYKENVKGKLVLDTTSGKVEKNLTFHLSSEKN